ncbi:hypothetical protein CV093_08460 [Oceanobacillus sp. 143]|nr:hypothetical protein CV093_08460 [Oceanobacillus sp. 143]
MAINPILRSYLELNVRTYVKRKGVSGVYFFSLDVNNLFTVVGARLATLPYFHAQMKLSKKDDVYHFSSTSTGKEQVKLKGNYRPIGKTFYPKKGSHDYWLLERYFSWTFKGGMLYRSDLHHKQWEIQHVKIKLEELALPMVPNALFGEEAVLHYAREKVALNWMIKKEK